MAFNHSLFWVVVVAWISTACLTACHTAPGYVNAQALQQYLHEAKHGLRVNQQAANTNMSVIYKPVDLLVYQQLDAPRSTKDIETLKAAYERYAYFTLRLETEGKDVLYGTSANQAAFSEKLQTLAYQMHHAVTIVTSAQDTIPVADYLYARNFGNEKSTQMLFAFDNEKLRSAAWFSLYVKEFGLHTGVQRFRFSTANIAAVPALRF